MKVSMAMPVTKQMGMIFLRIGASGMLDGSGFMLARCLFSLAFFLLSLISSDGIGVDHLHLSTQA